MTERLLTAREVAEWLQVSVSWISQHANGARRPFLVAVRLGRSLRFRRADVEEFIQQCAKLETGEAA